MLNAIDDAARNFYLHYGFQPSPDPFQLMLLMQDLRSSLNAILKAIPMKRYALSLPAKASRQAIKRSKRNHGKF